MIPRVAASFRGPADINAHLSSIDIKTGRLVVLGESQDEREIRDAQHRDLKDMVQEMIDRLKEEIRMGEQRRAARKALPSA